MIQFKSPKAFFTEITRSPAIDPVPSETLEMEIDQLIERIEPEIEQNISFKGTHSNLFNQWNNLNEKTNNIDDNLDLLDANQNSHLQLDGHCPSRFYRIYDWYVKSVPNEPYETGFNCPNWIIVEGLSEDGTLVRQSSRIVDVFQGRLLRTHSGSEYQLAGKCNLEKMKETFSSDFVMKFSNGFPVHWRSWVVKEFSGHKVLLRDCKVSRQGNSRKDVNVELCKETNIKREDQYRKESPKNTFTVDTSSEELTLGYSVEELPSKKINNRPTTSMLNSKSNVQKKNMPNNTLSPKKTETSPQQKESQLNENRSAVKSEPLKQKKPDSLKPKTKTTTVGKATVKGEAPAVTPPKIGKNDQSEVKTTRFGRKSTKPLQFWNNEYKHTVL